MSLYHKNPADITMQLFPQFRIAQKWTPILLGKNGVDHDLRK